MADMETSATPRREESPIASTAWDISLTSNIEFLETIQATP